MPPKKYRAKKKANAPQPKKPEDLVDPLVAVQPDFRVRCLGCDAKRAAKDVPCAWCVDCCSLAGRITCKPHKSAHLAKVRAESLRHVPHPPRKPPAKVPAPRPPLAKKAPHATDSEDDNDDGHGGDGSSEGEKCEADDEDDSDNDSDQNPPSKQRRRLAFGAAAARDAHQQDTVAAAPPDPRGAHAAVPAKQVVDIAGAVAAAMTKPMSDMFAAMRKKLGLEENGEQEESDQEGALEVARDWSKWPMYIMVATKQTAALIRVDTLVAAIRAQFGIGDIEAGSIPRVVGDMVMQGIAATMRAGVSGAIPDITIIRKLLAIFGKLLAMVERAHTHNYASAAAVGEAMRVKKADNVELREAVKTLPPELKKTKAEKQKAGDNKSNQKGNGGGGGGGGRNNFNRNNRNRKRWRGKPWWAKRKDGGNNSYNANKDSKDAKGEKGKGPNG